MMDGGMPAEGNDPMMGVDTGMSAMQLGGDIQNPYDANFDAGVEADEETDPKKYIQQLTGKLSQSLRKYNEGLPQPDADLDKYVAGMIVKQCIEGLPQEDVQEILDKVNTDEQEQPMGNGQDIVQQPMDQNLRPQPNQQAQTDNQQPMPPVNENVARRQAISSRYEELTNDKESAADDKVTNRNSYHKSPWVGKTFKS